MLETATYKAHVVEPRPPTPQQMYSAVVGVQTSMNYALNFRQKTLIDGLHIDKSIIDDGSFNAAGIGYVRWLQANTNFGLNAFLVSRIACIYVSVSS